MRAKGIGGLASRLGRLAGGAGGAAIAFALAACTKGEPMAPDDNIGPPPEPTYTVTVSLRSVTALSICEEAFTDFDGGEFIWLVSVQWPDGTASVLNQTPGYPSAAGWLKMDQGVPRSVAGQAVKTITGRSGAIRLMTRASEVDFDLFGANPARDGKMNDAAGQTVLTADANGWPRGPFTVPVQPQPACRFQSSFEVLVTGG